MNPNSWLTSAGINSSRGRNKSIFVQLLFHDAASKVEEEERWDINLDLCCCRDKKHSGINISGNYSDASLGSEGVMIHLNG